MISEVIIIDDVVPKSYQDYLEKSIIESDIPWTYRPNLGNNTPIANVNDPAPAVGIIHVFSNEQGIKSRLFYKILPMIKEACRKANYKLTGVFGGRTFIQFPAKDNSTFTKIHTDLNVDHTVLLYYVKDSDGDTIIFNKTTNDIPKDQLNESELSVIKRITPKKGRAVLFNGLIYHATTLPVLGSRCVININLK